MFEILRLHPLEFFVPRICRSSMERTSSLTQNVNSFRARDNVESTLSGNSIRHAWTGGRVTRYRAPATSLQRQWKSAAPEPLFPLLLFSMSSRLSGMLSMLRISPASCFGQTEDILTKSHGCGSCSIHRKLPDSLIAVVESEGIDALGHCARCVSSTWDVVRGSAQRPHRRIRYGKLDPVGRDEELSWVGFRHSTLQILFRPRHAIALLLPYLDFQTLE